MMSSLFWRQLALESSEFHSKIIFNNVFIFIFFLDFLHDFMRCIDFTRIAASNTASDYVTN